MIIMRFFFLIFFIKAFVVGYSFELHGQVDAIQMSTHNICLYKEVKKKYIGCNLKTTEFLDCALIGVCAVIRSNTVSTQDIILVGKLEKYLSVYTTYLELCNSKDINPL